jgi:AraC-like DNA-binding protein
MSTEPNIPPLPEPERLALVTLASAGAWLRLLRSDAVCPKVGNVAVGTVPGDWTTQPRSRESLYVTHYLFYCGETTLWVRLRDGLRALPPGTLAWFPPGVPYGLGVEPSMTRRMLYRLRFQVFHDGALVSPWAQPSFVESFDTFPLLADTIHGEFTVPGRYADERYRALLAQLSVETFRLLEEAEPDERRLSRAQMRRIVDYMTAHMAERPTPEDLAALVGLSPAYFARVFGRTAGMPPRQWILKQRIRHGARLLFDTALNVNEVAYELGYREPALFSRQFRTIIGMSPGAYRRQH